MTQFVHLHVHSEFSLADGIVKVKPLIKHAAEAGMPAVALTDINNLFALVKFFENATSSGVKPVVGVELKLATGRIVALAMNQAGYRNLIELISRTYVQESERGIVTMEQLRAHQAGLIVLSGGLGGHLAELAGKGDMEAHR